MTKEWCWKSKANERTMLRWILMISGMIKPNDKEMKLYKKILNIGKLLLYDYFLLKQRNWFLDIWITTFCGGWDTTININSLIAPNKKEQLLYLWKCSVHLNKRQKWKSCAQKRIRYLSLFRDVKILKYYLCWLIMIFYATTYSCDISCHKKTVLFFSLFFKNWQYFFASTTALSCECNSQPTKLAYYCAWGFRF